MKQYNELTNKEMGLAVEYVKGFSDGHKTASADSKVREAVKEASILVASLIDVPVWVSNSDLRHIQNQLTIIEDLIKES
jgi:hypothetical protein